MAEEHGFQSPEGHRLCANNCGFFGSPATQNMCSKCYRDLSGEKTGDSPLFSTPLTPAPLAKALVSPQEKSDAPAEAVATASPPPPRQQAANRCSACRKKVGLMGFRCRCGTTFCGTHRYPEKHACTFDFKAMGKEAIAKANPVVIADKLQKI